MPQSVLDLPYDPVDAEEAERLRFSDGALRLVPLTSGSWAIFGYANSLDIIPALDAEGEEVLREISRRAVEYGKRQKARYISTAEARFYGEPDDRQWTRDRKRASRPTRPERVAGVTVETMEAFAIDL